MNSRLFLFAACFIFASQHSSCDAYTHENRGICGTRLVETMAIVCNYHYNSPNKKSVNWNLEDPADYMDEYTPNFLSNPSFRWLDNDVNSAIIPRRHQRQNGIVEECCKKPCTINVLRSYCSK